MSLVIFDTLGPNPEKFRDLTKVEDGSTYHLAHFDLDVALLAFLDYADDDLHWKAWLDRLSQINTEYGAEVQVPPCSFDRASGESPDYDSFQLTITCGSTDAQAIRYRTWSGDTEPTGWTPFNAAAVTISITQDPGEVTFVKAYARRTYYVNGPETLAVYRRPDGNPHTPEPTFSVAPNVFLDREEYVELACSDVDATIYYTTDGTNPTAESDSDDEPIPISGNGYTIIKAYAKNGEESSEIVTGLYKIRHRFDILLVVYDSDGGVRTEANIRDRLALSAIGYSADPTDTSRIPFIVLKDRQYNDSSVSLSYTGGLGQGTWTTPFAYMLFQQTAGQFRVVDKFHLGSTDNTNGGSDAENTIALAFSGTLDDKLDTASAYLLARIKDCLNTEPVAIPSISAASSVTDGTEVTLTLAGRRRPGDETVTGVKKAVGAHLGGAYTIICPALPPSDQAVPFGFAAAEGVTASTYVANTCEAPELTLRPPEGMDAKDITVTFNGLVDTCGRPFVAVDAQGEPLPSALTYLVDRSKPTINSVTIESDNGTSSAYAKPGDTVTVTITASDVLKKPQFRIAGTDIDAAIVTTDDGGLTWTASLVLDGSLTDRCTVTFLISGIEDVAGNPGWNGSADVTETEITSNDSTVRYYNAAPTLTDILIELDGGQLQSIFPQQVVGDDHGRIAYPGPGGTWVRKPLGDFRGIYLRFSHDMHNATMGSKYSLSGVVGANGMGGLSNTPSVAEVNGDYRLGFNGSPVSGKVNLRLTGLVDLAGNSLAGGQVTFATQRPRDIVFLLDTSGSMGDPAGIAGPDKYECVRIGFRAFVDEWNEFAVLGDRVGIVLYDSRAEDIRDLTGIVSRERDGASWDALAMQEEICALINDDAVYYPGSRTAMGAGIARAAHMIVSGHEANLPRKKQIILLANGQQNEGPDVAVSYDGDVATEFTISNQGALAEAANCSDVDSVTMSVGDDVNIPIHTISVGDDGDWLGRLKAVSDVSGGKPLAFPAETTPEGVRSALDTELEQIYTDSSPQVVRFWYRGPSSDPAEAYEFSLENGVRKLIVCLTWFGDEALDFSLSRGSRLVEDFAREYRSAHHTAKVVEMPSDTGPSRWHGGIRDVIAGVKRMEWVSMQAATAELLHVVESLKPAGPALTSASGGGWRIEVNEQGSGERATGPFHLSVIVDTAPLWVRLGPLPPLLVAGDRLPLNLDLALDHGALQVLYTVDALVTKPHRAVANLLAEYHAQLGDGQFAVPQGDPVPPAALQYRKLAAHKEAGTLMRRRTTQTVALARSVAVAPRRKKRWTIAHQGVVADVPGVYNVEYRIRGVAKRGGVFERTALATFVVGIKVDLGRSAYRMRSEKKGILVIEFTPMDRLGNLLGPGRGSAFEHADLDLKVRDCWNGTYEMRIRGVDKEDLRKLDGRIRFAGQVLRAEHVMGPVKKPPAGGKKGEAFRRAELLDK